MTRCGFYLGARRPIPRPRCGRSPPAALAACTPPEPPEGQVGIAPAPRFGGLDFHPDRIYASIPDERFPLDGADLREVDEQFLRTMA
jgi:hypothetical protein